MLSSTTLEAQRNENDKFFDLMAAIGEHFRGEFNEAEKALELDLNGANSFLGSLHTFATLEIVTKNENGEFECKEFKNLGFIKAIKAILGEKSDKDVRNFLKAIIVPKSSAKMPSKIVDSVKLSYDEVYNIKRLVDENSFKKVEHLLNELFVKFSEEKLFNLLFSFAARLEALVHGKNIDGTLKEKEKNSKDKIQTFLAVPKCCKKFDNEEAKLLFLNNVRYDLAINFEFNQRKDIYGRADDLLSKWVGHRDLSIYGIEQISEKSYLKKNASQMLRKIKHFTKKTNRETISIIDALIGKEHIDQFNLVALFDQIKPLVEVAIPEEQDKFWKAKKEINTKQLEKEIEFLKKNPKSIAEEKYKKAVAIICTIKQFGS